MGLWVYHQYFRIRFDLLVKGFELGKASTSCLGGIINTLILWSSVINQQRVRKSQEWWAAF